jgi:hypothetical protein
MWLKLYKTTRSYIAHSIVMHPESIFFLSGSKILRSEGQT